MIPPRLLVPATDTYCRPTPYQIVQRVPGLAFNFSSVLPHRILGPLNEAEASRDVSQIFPRPRRITFTLTPFHPTAIAS